MPMTDNQTSETQMTEINQQQVVELDCLGRPVGTFEGYPAPLVKAGRYKPMPNAKTNKRPYKEPFKVRGKYLFGYWLPFFGFRDSFPPRVMTTHLRLKGPTPALVAQWFGRGFQIFLRRKPKGD
jgi:hypothetical protein